MENDWKLIYDMTETLLISKLKNKRLKEEDIHAALEQIYLCGVQSESDRIAQVLGLRKRL